LVHGAQDGLRLVVEGEVDGLDGCHRLSILLQFAACRTFCTLRSTLCRARRARALILRIFCGA
jgi:hypothetical protein